MLRTTFSSFAFAQLRGRLPKTCPSDAQRSMVFLKIFKNYTLQKLSPPKCPQGFSDIFYHFGCFCEALSVKGKSYRSGFPIFGVKFQHEIV